MAWKFVPFLLVGTVFNGIALFQGCIFAAVKNTKEVSKTTLVGAGISILCSVLFVYYIGAIGSALAALLGYLATWIMRTIKLNQIIKMKVNWKNHIASCILLIMQSVFALSEKTMYLQIIAAIVLLFLQRKYFLMLAVKIREKVTEHRRKGKSTI